jgi:very-short-patch-repair endonuclease
LGIYHNANKTFGSQRSKLEEWLELKLLELFPDMDFIFNGREAIKAELDIYIPTIKLAFELDGIFHYKPIFGIKKFTATQNKDHKKEELCIEKGIQLIRLNVSIMKKFTPENGIIFLDMIKNHIKEKLI